MWWTVKKNTEYSEILGMRLVSNDISFLHKPAVFELCGVLNKAGGYAFRGQMKEFCSLISNLFLFFFLTLSCRFSFLIKVLKKRGDPLLKKV